MNDTTCPKCNVAFCPIGAVKYCSDWCRKRQAKNDYKARTGESKRYRARKLGATTVEKFSYAEVYLRDGYTCHLCGDAIDKTLSFPHPRSATIDHVVPLADGGQHTLDNCRPAHKECNESRDSARFGTRAGGKGIRGIIPQPL